MIKRIITKLKNLWIKFKEKIFGKKYTKQEIFLGLYEYIKVNHSDELNMQCLCGCFLNYQNIEMQFCKDFVWIIHDCPKCRMRNQRRYDYEFTRLKD
jgi:hypothetical protein